MIFSCGIQTAARSLFKSAAAAYEFGLVKVWAEAPETDSVKQDGEEERDEEHFAAASLAPDRIPHDLITSRPQLRPYLSLQVCLSNTLKRNAVYTRFQVPNTC